MEGCALLLVLFRMSAGAMGLQASARGLSFTMGWTAVYPLTYLSSLSGGSHHVFALDAPQREKKKICPNSTTSVRLWKQALISQSPQTQLLSDPL